MRAYDAPGLQKLNYNTLKKQLNWIVTTLILKENIVLQKKNWSINNKLVKIN